MIKCVLCGETEGLESHHLWPTHLGGPIDGPQIMICGVCHTRVHNAANKIYRGGVWDEVDPVFRYKAGPVVQRIVRAMREAEDADLSEVASRIILKVPKATLKQIHLRKTDLGYSSLEAYLMSLIERDLPPGQARNS